MGEFSNPLDMNGATTETDLSGLLSNMGNDTGVSEGSQPGQDQCIVM